MLNTILNHKCVDLNIDLLKICDATCQKQALLAEM